MNKRFAILLPENSSPWQSTNFITENLIKLYKGLDDISNHISFFSFPITSPNNEWEEIIEEIVKNGFTHLVLLFSAPSPFYFLRILDEKAKNVKAMPEILLHVFGCFSSWAPELKGLEQIKTKLKVIVPSEAQRELLAPCFPKTMLHLCPFPLADDFFAYSEEERKSLRLKLLKDFSLPQNAQLVLYTGRAHPQKNVDVLFQSLMQLQNEQLYFIFCGTYDDHAIGRLNLKPKLHSSFQAIQHLQQAYAKRFIDLGLLPYEQIKQIIKSVDFFASFSTYHDEDFGMAPLEALALGTPALLSSWAGYKSFASPYTRFQKVRFSNQDVLLSLENLPQQVKEMLSFSETNKNDCGQYFKERFSCSALTQTLQNIIESTNKHFQIDEAQIAKYHQGFDYEHSFQDYRRFYAPYVGEEYV